MFDLEKAISEWRQQIIAAGLKKGEAVDELEDHLRNDIQQQIQAGLTTQEAFESAVERIGGAWAIKTEFAKIGRPLAQPRSSHHTRFPVMLKSFLLVLGGTIAISAALHNFALIPVALIAWMCALFIWIYVAGNRGPELPPSTAFTPDAKQSLQLARAEAPRLNHDFIGTEHLLLGLLNSPSGIVLKVMRRLGVESDVVLAEIEKVVGPGLAAKRVAAEIPYTPRATRALALAVKEAEMLQQKQVNSEHIFLGLIKENTGVAGLVFRNLGININRARDEIVKEMNMRKSVG
jgi:hypothetical protein